MIGQPASICCQWRAEKPNEIMSSRGHVTRSIHLGTEVT